MREAIEDAVVATARFIFRVIIWDFVLFHLGRTALLIATLGRYPPRRDYEQSRRRIQWIGMATLIVLCAAAALFNNLHA